uniref:Beta-glucuronidase C-terminal domain-containing protein n=1 Tax=Arion vulgaris TaxID=1028688 RepID=A0A0B7BD96_9EUPU
MNTMIMHLRYLILQVLVIYCCTNEALHNKNVVNFQVLRSPETPTYKLMINVSSSLHETDVRFLSIALASKRVPSNWMGSQKLKNLASALAPSDIRLGGTSADFLIFNPFDRLYESSDAYDVTDTDDIYDSGHFDAADDLQNFTITGKQWENFNAFVAVVGWDLLFDVNLFFWRSDGLWDSTNAELLLNYSSARAIRIPYFQLGNEPNAFWGNFHFRINPDILANNFRILKDLISKYPLYASSSLCGPDVANVGTHGGARVYLSQFIAAGAYDIVDEYSLHHYYLDGDTATVQDFLSVTTLDSLKVMLDNALELSNDSPRPLPIQLTETSSAYGGGASGLSDRFIAGFLWLDKLGITAQYGVTRVFRQTLIGGAYALLSSSFDPAPDYYLSVLYKRLVEGPVFNISLDLSSQSLRVYAHCARRGIYSPGALVIYYLNLADAQTVLSFPQFKNATLDLYLLTPGDADGLKSKFVKLNGNVLLMDGSTLPSLSPQPYTGDVTVEGLTFGFIVVPKANVPLCVNYFSNLDH